LIGLKFQIVEREFRDLDEVLIWVDRNQLGRRNLTDEQRAFIMHRLYGSVKLAPHRPTTDENALNLSAFSGRDATAKKIAQMTGVSAATVKRAHQFGKVVEALQEISPKAAERVLLGEVRDALTMLPEVPKEALSFVAKELEERARSIKQILKEWRQRTFSASQMNSIAYSSALSCFRAFSSVSRPSFTHFP
jgi:hypothetical protein